MRFTYEDQGSSTFVVYHVAVTEEIDSMSLGMLTNNCIPGFAPASFFQKDAEKYIKYNVTGKVAAAKVFQGPVNKKRLTGLLQGIVDAMIAAEEYMLDPDSVELNLESIYMDPVTCETVVLCVPVFREDMRHVDLPLFLKNIVFNTQFDQTENTDHVAKIFNCLGAGSKLVLEDLKVLLDQIQGNHAPVQVNPVVSSTTQGTQPVVQTTGRGSQPSVHGGTGNVSVPTQHTVPPAGTVKSEPEESGPDTTEEKRMSMWYLLNHMSKENMAVYKGQQAREKGEKTTKKEKRAKEPKKKSKGPVKREPAFMIPGEQSTPASVGFDIPGQESASAKQPIQAALDLPLVEKESEKPAQESTPSINFGVTTVLGATSAGTTVLPKGGYPAPAPNLVRKSTGERVQINKQTFTIGIENYVDYRISGNSAVSRSHARIIVRGNEYFLVDTNSTNGTYVNGQKIKRNVEVPIENGCKLVFANEEFDFLIC